MVKLIAKNEGVRSQAIRVRGGVAVVKPGCQVPVEPCPELDDDAVAHFLSRGVAFLDQQNLQDSNVSSGKSRNPARARKVAKPAEPAATDILVGSNTLPAVIELGENRTVSLGDVVAAAHKASGLSVQDWNALSEDERDEMLEDAIEGMGGQAGEA